MSQGLPSALALRIAALTGALAPGEIARASTALSAHYRGGGGSQTVQERAGLAAYLTARLPATYAAIDAALGHAAARLAGFAPQSLLDAGAGPGTASWAAVERWAPAAITMLDRNATFRAAAATLARGHPVLGTARIVAGDLAAPPGRHDLVIAAYALAELPDAALETATRALWAATQGVLLLVEPGTPEGFARLLRCRTLLLAEGARMVAPCPGAHACPVAAPDWCHFSVRLPRSRAHMRAKDARVPFEDERFSYLVLARDGIAVEPAAARVLSQPRRGKAGVELKLCREGGVETVLVPSRDRAAFKAAARKEWGDPF